MKRWVSILLVCCMLMTLTPAALAADTDEAEPKMPETVSDMPEAEVSAGQTVQSETAAPLSDTAAPSEIIDSGYCGAEGDGTNLTWTLTADGTLTISGTGSMSDNRPCHGYYSASILNVVVEDGVTTLGFEAFADLNNLIRVTLPDSLTSIGEGAFSWCYSLTWVNIPAGVTEIPRCAFYSCEDLISIDLPAGIVSIGEEAFYNSGLDSFTLPETLTSIGAQAFAWCQYFEELEIPAGVSEIGEKAFINCTNLTTVTMHGSFSQLDPLLFELCNNLEAVHIDEENPFFCSRDGVVFSKDMETLVYYPQNHEWYASSYLVPDSVKHIGDYAFWDSNLHDIVLPEGLLTIGNSSFSNCNWLDQIIIPKAVVSIGDYAFSSDTRNTVVYFCGDAPTVGESAFDSFVYFLEGTVGWPEEGSRGQYDLWPGCMLTPDGIIAAGVGRYGVNWTFNYSSGTLSFDGSGYIEYCALQPWSEFSGRIKHLEFGDGAITISNNCFGYPQVEEVYIPESVVCIEPCAFVGCINLENIYVDINNERYFDVGGVLFEENYQYYDSCTGEYKDVVTLLQYPVGSPLGEYRVPVGTECISSWAFSYAQNLKEVSIPNSVAYIEQGVFENCENLESVALPDGITEIPSNAFHGCISLINVNIPDSVTVIDDSAFSFCYSLGEISIPNGVEYIGDYAFQWCPELESIYIPRSVATLGSAVFSSCDNLKEVIIDGRITSIENGALFWCYSLERIVLPDTLTCIDDSAFAGCINLKEIEIPAGVEQIGHYAFSDCKSLEGVYFLGDAPSVTWSGWSDSSFPAHTTLYYVEGKSGWTDSEYYDPENVTWCGYKLATWTPDFCVIKALQPDGASINGRGYARAAFLVTSFDGTPLIGQKLQYTLEGKQYTVISDGNGLFFVTTPETGTSKAYQLHFTMPQLDGELRGADQTISVTVTPLSYSQKWSGALGLSAEVGIGPGIGAGVGDVSFEANAVKASANAKVSGELSLEDSYDDGERTLEVVFKSDQSVGVEIKTGVEATAPSTVIDVAKASVGAKVAFQNSVGLKLENYSPYNMEQAIDLGAFLLQISLMCVDSATAQIILELLDIEAHNQSGYTNKVVLEAGASIAAVEIAGSEKNEFALLGADASTVVSFSRNRDFLKNTEVQSVAFGCDLGLSALSGVELPAGGSIFDSSVGNSFKLSATFDGNDELAGLSYKIDTEGSGDVLWFAQTYEDSIKVTYDSYEAGRIVENDALMQAFVDGSQTLLMPAALISSVLTVEQGDYLGVVEQSHTIKEGTTLSFPVMLDLGLSIEGKLSGTFMEEFSYAYQSGFYKDGHTYVTSVSTVSQSEFESMRNSLTGIIGDALNAVVDSLKNYFVTKVGSVVNGIATGFAELTGTEEWFAEIGSIDQGAGGGSRSRSSYTILALSTAAEPVSNAAVAVTIGAPYTIAIYTDSSKETLVSDEELAMSPLTITLGYDWSMLSAAGVGYDADILIYRFDSERNTYIPVPGCVQDKDHMTVTAPIAAHGEYILATDNASPLVSNFVLSDQTAMPTLSVLVSDLSGIREFSFWLDDGDVLVDIEKFESYYNYSNNAFTYAFNQALASGEHTVYFQAADTLGNANAMPFSFTFTVDAEAPVISEVIVPVDIVTDPVGFSVTASVSDNEQVSQVVLSIVTDEGKSISLPMSEVDGIWTVDVVELEGVSAMNATVVAFDWAGNRNESEPYAIEIDVPDAPAAIELSAEWTEGGWSAGVSVTIKTNQQQAIGGWLICAVYNQDGKMVGIDNVYAGLQAIDEQTYTLTFDCDAAEIYSGTVFFVDINNGYIPFCEGANLPLRVAD